MEDLFVLCNLSAIMSQSDKISKFVRSRAVGIKVSPMLSTSFSDTVSS